MRAVLRAFRPFWITCILVFIALSIAAVVYGQQHPTDPWISTAVLPAFLLEALFYLTATFRSVREALVRTGSPRTEALALWGSAVLPYLVFSLATGTFRARAFYLLLGLTAVLSVWQAVLPRRLLYDLGFLVVAAAPIVARVFVRIYQSPDPTIHVDVLGHVMWLRVGIFALLGLRRWDPGSFGLWPAMHEWKAGVLWYLVAIVPIAVLALGLQDVHWAPLHKEPLVIAGITVGTFFGILWVVALGEELLFRGVIARAVLNASSSPVAAVVVSAILFGTAHLWFHAFPNWRRALVGTLLGVFCGMAYVKSRSVRVPMVTHALVVTTWRIFFV